MAELDSMQTTIKQVAIQVATASDGTKRDRHNRHQWPKWERCTDLGMADQS